MSGVEIRVRSDSRQARRDLSQLENSVKNIETRTARATSAFRKMAIGIGAALAGGAVIKGVNRASDSLVNLENRIALVTGRGKALDKTMNDLFKIAKRTRGDIGGSAETFNRFGIALKDSGKSAEEILRAVESVNKAVAISGSGAESARAALFQLGQGLASGQLRGQELNSVLEQAPRLAGAIADEMGKPLGALRKLAEQGEVTTDVVFNALINQAGQLSKEFETMEGTSEQAFSVMKDQIGRVTGEISAALNITGAFTQRFNAISDSLEKNRVSIVSNVVGSVQSIGKVFTGVKDSIAGVAAIIATAVRSLLDFARASKTIDLKFIDLGILDKASKGLKNIVSFLRDAKDNTKFVERAMSNMANAISNAVSSLNDVKNTALEKLAKLAKRASKDMEMLYIRAKLFSAIKYVEFRGGNGVIADLQMYIKVVKAQQKAEKSAKALFKNTANFAKEYLSKAWKSIKTFLNLIERKFYWVYDEVIQNSWWTDTMEQTYYLAEKWLGKASDTVSKFGDTVNDKFRKVFASFKDGQKSLQNGFSIKDVKIKFSKATGNFKELAQTVTTTVTEGLRTAFDTLGAISPVLSATFGAALVAGVTKFLSPALFKKTFARIGPLAIVALFAGLASGISAQIVDSGIFKQLGANLGTTLAVAFDAFIDLIPAGVDAAIQSLSSLGKAFGKQLEGSIIGLPAKILSFIPGGGLLTTILYGGGGFLAIGSIFSKNIRALVVKTVASSAALTSATGVMGSILFGTLGARKGLGVLAVTTTASIALFGDLVGTEVSSIIGVITGIMATSFLSGQGAMAALGGSFAGLRTLITTGAVKIATAGTLAFKTITVAGVSAYRTLTAQSLMSTNIMSRNFQALSAKGSASMAFLTKGKGRLLGIAGAAVLATAALSGAANASTTLGEDLGASGLFSLDNLFIGLTALSFASMLKKPIIGGFRLLGKSAAGSLLAGFARAIATGIGAAVATVVGFLGGPFIAGLLAAGAVLTIGYVAIFGDEGSFLDAVKRTLTKVKRFFGLTFDNDLKIGLDVKTKGRELRARGALDRRTADNLQNLDFAGLSQKNAFLITTSVNDVHKLTDQANKERLRYGRVSIATANKLEAAQRATTAAIQNAPSNNESADRVSSGIGKQERNLAVNVSSTGAISNAFASLKIAGILIADRIKELGDFGVQSGLKDRLEGAKFTSNADFTDPEQFQKIISQGFLKDTLKDTLPSNFTNNKELMEAIKGIALSPELPSQQLVDNLVRAIDEGRSADRSLIRTAIESTLNAVGVTDFTRLQKASTNALTANDNEGEQQFILETLRNVDLVNQALRENNLELDSAFAKITIEERRLLARVVSSLNDEREKLENFKVESSSAGSNEEVKAAQANAELSQAEVNRLKIKLRDAVEQAVATGIDNTSVGMFKKLLDKSGIEEDLALRISQGLTQGVEDFNLPARFSFMGNATDGGALDEINDLLATARGLNGAIEQMETSTGSFDDAQTSAYLSTKQNLTDVNERIGNLAELFNIQDIEAGEVDNLVTSAVSLSKIDNLDLNKMFQLGPDTAMELARVSSQIQAIKFAMKTGETDTLEAMFGEKLSDNSIAQELSDLTNQIDAILTPFGDSIRTGFLSPFDTLLEGTSLSLEQAGNLSAKASKKIVSSLDNIKKAQDNLSKGSSSIFSKEAIADARAVISELTFKRDGAGVTVSDNREQGSGDEYKSLFTSEDQEKLNKAQETLNSLLKNEQTFRLQNIKAIEEAERLINEQLLNGTVGTARQALENMNVDSNLLFESDPQALQIGIDLANKQKELNNLAADEVEERQTILGQIKEQERLLNGITDKARSSADGIRDSFKGSLSSLMTGEISSLEDAFKPLLDSLSTSIIDTFVDSFTEALFQSAGLDTLFEDLFSNMFKSGDDVGDKSGGFLSGLFKGGKKDEEVQGDSKKAAEPFGGVFNEFLGGLGDKFGGITEAFGGIFGGFTGSLGGLFDGLGGTFSSLLGSLGSSLSGLFSGGGGGGMGGLVSLGMSFLGFSQGGVVPNTPFSQAGKDSVPAMLMPGEVVMSKNAVRNDSLNQGSQQSFNINVQGDVSRQTRKEIVKMMPQIAGGVNATNKENNRR